MLPGSSQAPASDTGDAQGDDEHPELQGRLSLHIAAGGRADERLQRSSVPRQTAEMPPDPRPVESVINDLIDNPVRTEDVRTRAPSAPGLYAWWAPPAIVPDLVGVPHPTVPDQRLLYIGLATKLRSRLASNHLRRTGSSTLRRTLAGLLLDEQGYRTRWTDRVVLVDDDEARLTEWMGNNLRVSWCEYPTPGEVEGDIIRALRPPLNLDHASGPSTQVVKTARRRYHDSAGPRP